jgi:hypothetical protein
MQIFKTPLARTVAALLAGLIFGIGLIMSGMTNPAKLIGFLDLAGKWDPSLALVMGGAILVGVFAFRFAAARPKTLLGEPIRLPTSNQIDTRLVLGALTFGAGWGLAGFCPGPAIASLATGGSKAVIFTLAMLGGMAIFELLERFGKAAP